MRFFGQLIAAVFERVGSAPASTRGGRPYYRTDLERPYMDDDTTVDQLMMEKHLPEARRDTKVQLDATDTGIEVIGTLAIGNGGTGLNSVAGQANKPLVVNGAATGFTFGTPTELEIFRGQLSSPQTVTGNTGFEIIDLNTEVGGAGTWQNFATLDTVTNVGRVTVDTSAWYRVTWSLSVFNYSGSDNECGVFVNGGQYNDLFSLQTVSAGFESFSGKTGVVYLTANDYLELKHRGTGDGDYNVNANGTYMAIELLRV